MKRWGLAVSILTILTFSVTGMVHAQSAEPRFEIGALASFLRLSTFETSNAGFGGRVSFDLSPWAALEAEATFFPNDDILEAPSILTPNLRVAYERQRTDAFFGLKMGRRTERVGAFAKVRPGLTRLSEVVGGQGCIGPECPFVLLARPEYPNRVCAGSGRRVRVLSDRAHRRALRAWRHDDLAPQLRSGLLGRRLHQPQSLDEAGDGAAILIPGCVRQRGEGKNGVLPFSLPRAAKLQKPVHEIAEQELRNQLGSTLAIRHDHEARSARG